MLRSKPTKKNNRQSASSYGTLSPIVMDIGEGISSDSHFSFSVFSMVFYLGSRSSALSAGQAMSFVVQYLVSLEGNN